MKIHSVSNVINNSPSFRSTNREVIQNGKLLYKNKTRFFRDDLDWCQVVNFLREKYKDTSRVNIINTACSDGTEPYSLAMILMEKLKSASSKFFPIKATDIDKQIIDMAKNQPCNLTKNDFWKINKHTNSNYFKYLNLNRRTDPDFEIAARANKTLKSVIEFKQADVFQSLEDLEPQNNVILCRNFWNYMTPQNIFKLVEKLKQLDSTNTVIIGELERGWGYNKLLEKAGFKEIYTSNIFEKE